VEVAAPQEVERASLRPLTGWQERLASTLAVALSGYALYWVLFIVQPQIYRVSFLLVTLVLTFLSVPARRGRPREGPSAVDWLLAGTTIVALGWPIVDFQQLVYRAAEPSTADLVLGSATVLLVLEATRRTVGPVLPLTAVGFLAYAWAGPLFERAGLSLLAHRGYGLDRLVGALYLSLEGIFGIPLDVAATYIILFTIYGAVLERSGAGSFFINWALSASGRSAAAPGRSVTVAGFLLGTVSGSGVATTVMLGSVAWPVLRRAGFAAETAGAMLSAAGIGALLSPPTLGAAAFLIAEFLRISYLQVLVMATVPTVLYYLSIFLMIEGDARRATAGAAAAALDARSGGQGCRGADDTRATPAALTRRYWYHFTSLVAIAVLMVSGMSAFRAVFWATVLAVGLSFIRRETALTPRRLLGALRTGGYDVIGVAATTATAGIIVGVVTLTGLGLEIAGVIVSLAGGKLVLTVIYSAIAVWLLGLAVPVTASYIIAAVMVAPALVRSGVPDFAAHMFIFYYAVLSEVSPPTALSPFAAAALTGGNPFRTMVLTWKYTLPAFMVPFVFTVMPDGAGVLLHGTGRQILVATLTATAGIAALAVSLGGWLRTRLGAVPRAIAGAAGVLLLFGPAGSGAASAVVLAVVFILHYRGHTDATGAAAVR
jgi:TRAP transporter 4TM/12TM fusion protein